MDPKFYSIIISSSILAFALIAAIIPTIIENVFAQEGAITPESSVNDTMSGKSLPPWVNATLAFAQVNDTGMTQDGEMDNTN